MSDVFQNIDPPTPSPPASVYPPPHSPPLVRGEDTLAAWRGGGGSVVRKTPDTALYSIYVSTLWVSLSASVQRPGEGVMAPFQLKSHLFGPEKPTFQLNIDYFSKQTIYILLRTESAFLRRQVKTSINQKG
jgi:hypothetical protein